MCKDRRNNRAKNRFDLIPDVTDELINWGLFYYRTRNSPRIKNIFVQFCSCYPESTKWCGIELCDMEWNYHSADSSIEI